MLVMKQSSIKLLNKYVAENSKVFKTDGEELYCKVCNTAVDFDEEYIVEQHLKTQNHIEKLAEIKETVKAAPVDLIDKYVLENCKVFETDGKVLFCNACNTVVNCGKRSMVDQHLKTQKHIENCMEIEGTASSVSNKELLNKYVLEYNDVYKTEGKELFCKICKMSVPFDKKHLVNQHLKTQNHIDKYKEIIETESAKPNREMLSIYVSENNEVLKTDGKKLICKICNKSISFETKYLVHRHLNSKKHKKIIAANGGSIPETKIQKVKLGTTELLNKYVSENTEVFETDGEMLFCKVCKKSVSFEKKFLVDQHFQTQKHKENYKQCFGIAAQDLTTKDLLKSSRSPSKQSTAEMLKRYVSQNSHVFETDGAILFCKVCSKSVSFDKKFAVDQHLRTQKHKNNFAQSVTKSIQDVTSTGLSVEKHQLILKMNEDFCRTCMKQFSKAKEKHNKQNMSEIPTGCQNNTSIMELLGIIQPQIKVEIKDNLPTLVCSDCIQKLLISYEFIEMYQIADKKLREMLDEYDMDKCKNSSNKPQQAFLEEMEASAECETNKYQIEQINIDGFDREQNESDNYLPELKDEPEKELAYGAENNETVFSPPNSDDECIPEKNCLNVSLKEHNSDDVTKKVFKGFFQPEKNDDGSLTCKLCESVLNGVILWQDHIRKQHLEEKPKNAYNGNNQRKKGNPNYDKKISRNEEGLYQCEYCEESYPKYIFYRRHLRKHTAEPHLCIECGKSFCHLSSYTSHMLRHKGEKTYACPHCPKSFVCPSGLYNHALTHTNNKPYVCDTCGSAFHMAYQLKKHNRIHTGIKKYQCEYCDMRFITGEKQRRHMRTHTGEKPYRCKYCERAFAQSNERVKHLRQHLGDNVYQCDLCPLRYPLLRELRVHFASHKDDDEKTRADNLQARMEAERNLQIKLVSKESV